MELTGFTGALLHSRGDDARTEDPRQPAMPFGSKSGTQFTEIVMRILHHSDGISGPMKWL